MYVLMVGVLVEVWEGVSVAVGVWVGIKGVFVGEGINVAVDGTFVHVGGMVDVLIGLGRNVVEIATVAAKLIEAL
jgi:hypothetical protein